MDELYVYRGTSLLGRYELHATELVLGRAGHIVLDSPSVSRIHALLSFHAERGYVLTDLGSRNGTRVNGGEVTEQVLKTGDVVELGEFTLRCNLKGVGATMRAPALAARDGLDDTAVFKRAGAAARPAVQADHPAMERAASSRIAAVSPDFLKGEAPKKLELPATKTAEARKPEAPVKAEPVAKVEPKKEEPKKDAPAKPEEKKDEAKKDEPKKEDAKKDAAKPEAKKDEPKKDEPKKEDAKKDEPKKDEPKKEDAKKDEPKKEDAKKDAPAKPDAKKDDAKKDAPAKPAEPKKDAPAVGAPKREAVGAEVRLVYESYFKRLRRLARADAEPTKPDARPIQTDLSYPKRSHPWRYALRMSWLVATLLSIGWIGAEFARGRRQLFTSESVSKGHQIFGNDCARCHVQHFSLEVTDAACLACHDGLLTEPQFELLLGGRNYGFSTHHANESHAPHCASCHVEHGGNAILKTAVNDLHCTTCHADLAASVSAGAPLAIVATGRTIASLTSHVEFAALSRPDAATLALNHARHMGAPLSSMETPGRQAWLKEKGRDHMVCGDCHELDASRRDMRSIRYAAHCQQCHPLEAAKDPAQTALLPEPIEHGVEPKVLIDHLRALDIESQVKASYEKYIEAHPEELKTSGGGGGGPPRRGPGGPGVASGPKTVSPAEWVQKKIDRWKERGLDGIVDDVLHADNKNGCVKCHKLDGDGDATRIVPTAVPSRWLIHSFFNHEKHLVVSCIECHDTVMKSEKTSDVNLPGVASCRTCHRAGGAGTTCTMCHLYHDRGPDRRDMNGRMSRGEFATPTPRTP
jgi:pSer/pThr/pTyr-binding forkhead associated (FHA) protein